MKRILLAIVFLLFLTPCAFADPGGGVRVGLIVFNGDTLFDDDYYEAVRKSLDQGVNANYDLEGNFQVIEENRRAYMDEVDRRGEDYVITYLDDHGLDLLLYSEMSTDGAQIVFKCYQKTGTFDDFYLPYSPGLDRYLPEVAVGTFLGLIERLDGKLFENRRY